MFIVQRLISSATQWFVQPVPGKQHIYTITAGPSPPEPGVPGFRRDLFKGPNDVINSSLPGEWHFVPVAGFPDVFESAPLPSKPVLFN